MISLCIEATAISRREVTEISRHAGATAISWGEGATVISRREEAMAISCCEGGGRGRAVRVSCQHCTRILLAAHLSCPLRGWTADW